MISSAVTTHRLKPTVLAILCLSLTACTTPTRQLSTAASAPARAPGNEFATDVFADYIKADPVPADGFDFPFGHGDGAGSYQDKATGKRHDGWYVATHFGETYSLGIHPGEDWNGSGGGNTDLGQDVFAVANGRTVFAANCGRLWGNVIVIEHLFYENHEKKKIRSLYAHLQKLNIRAGEVVRKRQPIGTIGQDPEKSFNAHLHLELRRDESLGPTYWPTANNKDLHWVREHYTEPSSFIKSHRKTLVPQTEPLLILVDRFPRMDS